MMFFLLLLLICCFSCQEKQQIIEKNSSSYHKAVVIDSKDSRSISVKIWETDSTYTRYSLVVDYDSLTSKPSNIQTVQVKTTIQNTDSILNNLFIAYRHSTIDSPIVGIPQKYSTYAHIED